MLSSHRDSMEDGSGAWIIDPASLWHDGKTATSWRPLRRGRCGKSFLILGVLPNICHFNQVPSHQNIIMTKNSRAITNKLLFVKQERCVTLSSAAGWRWLSFKHFRCPNSSWLCPPSTLQCLAGSWTYHCPAGGPKHLPSYSGPIPGFIVSCYIEDHELTPGSRLCSILFKLDAGPGFEQQLAANFELTSKPPFQSKMLGKTTLYEHPEIFWFSDYPSHLPLPLDHLSLGLNISDLTGNSWSQQAPLYNYSPPSIKEFLTAVSSNHSYL